MISEESYTNDDIYGGYNEYPSIYTAKNLGEDLAFQAAVDVSNFKRKIMTPKLPTGTAMRFSISSGFRRTGAGLTSRPGTGPRLMTAVRGAGYSSNRQVIFDPLNVGNNSRGPAPPLETGNKETSEEKIKESEKKIMAFVESSVEAACENSMRVALEHAKEASSRERVLLRLQEQLGLNETHDLNLTFIVLFNLAIQYTNNEMYTEALGTYQAIARNKVFGNSARLKFNMGNIYVKIGQSIQAIKMYRKALDQVPITQKDLRIKIMHNIGMLFVQMGRLEEAAGSFEWVMRERPEFKAGLHAILCHYALSHCDKMKRGFLELLEVQLNIDQDKYTISSDDVELNILGEVMKTDTLSMLETEMKLEADKTILNAAKLIAPVIEDNLTLGFAWCADAIRSSAYSQLTANLEISKAMILLHNRETALAIDTLKMFENRDTKVNSAASTMLSFIYFLQGEYEQANRCGESASKSDSYNSAAYVNLSACAIKNGELDRARELLLCALDSDASHVQALYNLGLVYKKLGWYDEALECFWKLHYIIRYDPQILYQIGHLCQFIKDTDQASEWYNQLLGIVSSDPGVLQKLGEMYHNQGDKQQAYQYYIDSYRCYSANFEVIDWLGSYFISMQVPEKALIYFERAVELAPDQPRWHLLVAACLRRTGQFHKALEEYKNIHRKFPENIECLKFLIRLCSDLGLKEAQLYALELKKAEKSKELKERPGSAKTKTSSKRSNSGNSSRGGSGVSVQSDYRSSPNTSRKETRSFLNSRSSSRLNRFQILDSNSTDFSSEAQNDVIYFDLVGPLPTRPITAVGKRDDDFGDEELGDDLLPV